MSVAMCDYNDDGYPDILVSCDLTDIMLFRNNANGTFTDVAMKAGIACGPHGFTPIRHGH